MQKNCKQNATDDLSHDEAVALLSKLRQWGVIQSDIADATGIHQGQVSRILNGHFKSVRGNVLIVCKYAKQLDIARSAHHDDEMEKQIVAAALELWDRTDVSGRRVIALLKALKDVVRG